MGQNTDKIHAVINFLFCLGLTSAAKPLAVSSAALDAETSDSSPPFGYKKTALNHLGAVRPACSFASSNVKASLYLGSSGGMISNGSNSANRTEIISGL